MLSVGPQELMILGALLLFLTVCGSSRFSSTARELGQLLGGTKRAVEEAKSELIPQELAEARKAIKDLKTGAPHGADRGTRHRKP